VEAVASDGVVRRVHLVKVQRIDLIQQQLRRFHRGGKHVAAVRVIHE
jgi:hypothetical protein